MTGRKRPDYSKGAWASAFTPRARGEVRHWLVKSEPETFSWADLLASHLMEAAANLAQWDRQSLERARLPG